MNSRIVTIPVLAAIWLGSPVPALAQDQEPRHAQSRPRDTTREPRGTTRETRSRERDANRGYRQAPSPAVYNSPANNRPPAHPYSSSYRPQYYAPVYYDRWAYNTYRFSPLRYVPWSLIYGSVGFANSGYYSFGFNYGYPAYPAAYPAYGGPAWYGGGYYPVPSGPTSYDTGEVRLQIRPREAEVFVDGYYAGHVDDFDGTFQSLRLDQGGHKIEVKMPGLQTFEIDVHVQPGRTLTIREDLHP